MGTKAIRISAEFLLNLCRAGARHAFECVEGVPADATVSGVFANSRAREMTLFVDSAEWEQGVGDYEQRVVFRDIEVNAE